MVININLFPKRPKKPRDLFIMIPLVLLLVIGGFIYGFLEWQQQTQDIQQVETDIGQIEQLIAVHQVQLEESKKNITGKNFSKYYEQLSVFLRDYYIAPERLKRDVESALPNDATIQLLEFQLSGEMKITVTFPSQTHISEYIRALENFALVQHVDVPTIVNINDGDDYQVQLEVQVVTVGGDTL